MLENSEIPFVVFMSLCSFLGMIFNVSILIVYRKKYKQSTCLYFLTMLALINLIISFMVIPIVLIADLTFFSHYTALCKFSQWFRRFSLWMLVFLLGLIAYERFNVISAKTAKRLRLVEKSLIYHSRKSFLAIVLVSFVISVFSILIEIDESEGKRCSFKINTLGYEVYESLTVCLGLLIYLLMIVMYIKAYLIIYKSSKRIIDTGSNQTALKNKVTFENKQTTREERQHTVDANEENNYLKKKFEIFSSNKHDMIIHEVEDEHASKFSSDSSSLNASNHANLPDKGVYAISFSHVVKNKTSLILSNDRCAIHGKMSHFSKRKDWQVAKIFMLVIEVN